MGGMIAGERTEAWLLRSSGLHELISLLAEQYDEVIGPTVVDGVIRLRPISSVHDLPSGVGDQQEANCYRLVASDDGRRFAYGPGPDSLKSIVHPVDAPVWTMRRRDGSLVVDLAPPSPSRRAVIGARACDLRAVGVLERTQTAGEHPDPSVTERRDELFVVAVDCTDPAPTCFCASAGGSPRATTGFDLALTELDTTAAGVVYVVRTGSERGRRLVEQLELEPAPVHVVDAADTAVAGAAAAQLRELPEAAFLAVHDDGHPRWQEVGSRCTACTRCTNVCPTCFCTEADDVVHTDGSADRTRHWVSCFEATYWGAGGPPDGPPIAGRYHQWLRHKLGTWHAQFGESGCVGCGRCITWCPSGIDLTAEIEALALPAAEGVAR